MAENFTLKFQVSFQNYSFLSLETQGLFLASNTLGKWFSFRLFWHKTTMSLTNVLGYQRWVSLYSFLGFPFCHFPVNSLQFSNLLLKPLQVSTRQSLPHWTQLFVVVKHKSRVLVTFTVTGCLLLQSSREHINQKVFSFWKLGPSKVQQQQVPGLVRSHHLADIGHSLNISLEGNNGKDSFLVSFLPSHGGSVLET